MVVPHRRLSTNTTVVRSSGFRSRQGVEIARRQTLPSPVSVQPGARCWALTRVPELSIHMLLVQRKKMHAHPSMCLHEAISASRRIGENEGSDRMRFNMFRADTHMKVSSEKSSPPSIVNPTVRPFIAGTL
ncbi:hypothetical protein CISG_03851 [Coccidioides immitis RMSCC 3703]|uniref:Uncharacterized protein n=2 Tax=Coccidioides immitis TaxID=5501 RepID=A0A0J8QRI8_COCIT|nr:hypothetical protein CIRG_03024 [Coccidioides immitis RMSCC 2394]KMU73873.1 hypothetical protein CISG_03851 [Coccidioides immitis RMSCC 3703]